MDLIDIVTEYTVIDTMNERKRIPKANWKWRVSYSPFIFMNISGVQLYSCIDAFTRSCYVYVPYLSARDFQIRQANEVSWSLRQELNSIDQTSMPQVFD